jgi:hypothetical protein
MKNRKSRQAAIALKKANAVLKEEMDKLPGNPGLFFPGLI